MKLIIYLLSVIVPMHSMFSQNEFLEGLVDSIPNETPVVLKLKTSEGYFVAERIAFSKNGKELFYGERTGYNYDSVSLPKHKANILKIKYSNKKWNEPSIIFKDSAGAPTLSSDGKKMYFQYDHPYRPKGLISLKKKTSWTTPEEFNPSIKRSHYLQITDTGKYFYNGSISDQPKDLENYDIFSLETIDSKTVIKGLGFHKTGEIGWDFCIAKDESFIIIMMGKAKGKNNNKYTFYGSTDFFISFKDKKNNWTTPLNLGVKINGKPHDWKWGPCLSDNNKYFFYTSGSGDINGKSTQIYVANFENILQKLRKQALRL